MYYVHYVENCTPRLESFASKEKLDTFLKTFFKKANTSEDCWIDFAFKGKIIAHHSCDDSATKRSKKQYAP